MALCGILHPMRSDLWCVKVRGHGGLCGKGAACWSSATHVTRMRSPAYREWLAFFAQKAVLDSAEDCQQPIYVDAS